MLGDKIRIKKDVCSNVNLIILIRSLRNADYKNQILRDLAPYFSASVLITMN